MSRKTIYDKYIMLKQHLTEAETLRNTNTSSPDYTNIESDLENQDEIVVADMNKKGLTSYEYSMEGTGDRYVFKIIEVGGKPRVSLNIHQ